MKTRKIHEVSDFYKSLENFLSTNPINSSRFAEASGIYGVKLTNFFKGVMRPTEEDTANIRAQLEAMAKGIDEVLNV